VTLKSAGSKTWDATDESNVANKRGSSMVTGLGIRRDYRILKEESAKTVFIDAQRLWIIFLNCKGPHEECRTAQTNLSCCMPKSQRRGRVGCSLALCTRAVPHA